jgi:NADH-quinone oxidoreductase subunit A
MNTYLPIIIISLMALSVIGLMLGLKVLLGPKRKHSSIKDRPFECGNAPIETPRGLFGVKFYTIAQLFIIFDIELVFLFPWAIYFQKLGLYGLISMGIFILFVLVGLLYAWKEGALDWD